MFKFIRNQREKGQSLVEIAIIAPILVFLMIGGVEVGWALRGYLILGNVDREITRFAVRPGYLNFSQKDAGTVGYDGILAHAFTTLNQQLPLDFSETGNATLIVHHLVVDTGYPYQTVTTPPADFCSSFTADNPNGDPTYAYTLDNLILTPAEPGYEYYKEVYPENSTAESTVNYAELANDMVVQNNTLNCKLLKQDPSALPSGDNMVITELFFNQPQLLSFPGISNFATDPIRLHVETSMRLAEGEDIVTKGPVCAALPITFNQDIFGDPNNPTVGMTIDAFESDAPGNFGWLYWDPDTNDTQGANTIVEELQNPLMSRTAFEDANEPGDTHLNIGDDVRARTGVVDKSQVRDLLDTYVGKTVLIPVHSVAPSQGANAYYTVSHFARVTIKNICLPANGGDDSCGRSGEKRIVATFQGYADDACYDAVED